MPTPRPPSLHSQSSAWPEIDVNHGLSCHRRHLFGLRSENGHPNRRSMMIFGSVPGLWKIHRGRGETSWKGLLNFECAGRRHNCYDHTRRRPPCCFTPGLSSKCMCLRSPEPWKHMETAPASLDRFARSRNLTRRPQRRNTDLHRTNLGRKQRWSARRSAPHLISLTAFRATPTRSHSQPLGRSTPDASCWLGPRASCLPRPDAPHRTLIDEWTRRT